MLHPLNVIAYEAEMMRLVQFQRGLLKLAIFLKNGEAMIEASFQQVLGDEVGSWFWSKYVERVQNEDSVWKKKFDTLCVQCPHDANFQQAIMDAFDWDIQFHNHLTDTNWSFKYPQLPTDLQKAIKELFEHCYNYLGGTGYGTSIHGTPDLVLTRKQFLNSYSATNPKIKVCPVCDGRIEEHAHDDIFVITLDHFFPKAYYPFLSLHPYNLVPACGICNSTYKGEKDPLRDQITHQVPSNALANTYHAYRARAILTLDKLRAYRPEPPQNELIVEIVDLIGTSERRIKAANRVYSLTARWRKAIRSKVYEDLIHCLSCQPKENPQRSEDDLLKDLKFEKRRCRRGIKSDDVLREAYLEYALTDAAEQKYLLERYTGTE